MSLSNLKTSFANTSPDIYILIMGESLKNFETWAQATFPRAFKQMKDYLKIPDLSATIYGHCEIKYCDKKACIESVIVGDTCDEYPIHATVSKCSGLLVLQVHSRWSSDTLFRISHSTHGLQFKTPFVWLFHKDNNAKLAALTGYLLSIRFESFCQLFQSDDFREDLKEACDIIARKLAEQGRAAGTFNHCIRLSKAANALLSENKD